MSLQSKIADLIKVTKVGPGSEYTELNATTSFASTLMPLFIEKYLQSVEAALPYGRNIDENMSKDMLAYFELVLKLRCNQVNGKPLKFIHYSSEAIVLPAFVNILFNAVGKVEFDKEQVIITPHAVKLTDKDEKDWESYSHVRVFLKSIEKLGFVQARTLERSKEGNADFMTFVMIDGELKHHYNNSDPGIVFMRAFLDLSISESVWNNRITYGPVSALRHMVEEIVSPVAK